MLDGDKKYSWQLQYIHGDNTLNFDIVVNKSYLYNYSEKNYNMINNEIENKK